MPSRPAIGQLITWVYTDDLEVSSRFYRETLGLPLVTDQGAARIFRISEAAFIGVCRAFEGRAVAPAGSMISLVSDDVDGWYERLSAAGVKTRGRPQRLAAFNIYSFFAEDPNGYTIEVQQFLDPHWATAGGAPTRPAT